MKKIIYTILVAATPALAQISCPQQITALGISAPCVNPTPVREFGQPLLLASPNSSSPNLVAGQELFNPAGIAFDTSGPTTRVYVVDTGNNRVLGWSNADSLTQGNFADMVLGQPASPSGGFDFTSTVQWGPGTSYPVGLRVPTGIAVDAAGNVYVADSGNNRILRFATPYKQQPGNLVVDLVIGQKSVSSGNLPNMGQSTSQSSLSLTPNQQLFIAGLAIDSQGNLWAADPGNNRVLEFPAAGLTANNQLPQASVWLGQLSPNTNQGDNSNQSSATSILNPGGVAVDGQGNVYVTDGLARALVYAGPAASGEPAKVILGLPPTATQGHPPVYPSQSTLGTIASNGQVTGAPEGIFVSGSGNNVSVFVCDSSENRVVIYNSLTVPSGGNSPLESVVIGQNGYGLGQANQGSASPTNQSFSFPVAGAIRPDKNEMWIVDEGNHRVIAFPGQGGGGYTTATRVLGQKDSPVGGSGSAFTYGAANLLEGRELWLGNIALPGNVLLPSGGIAVDPNGCTPSNCTTSPYLYVADTQNNRVLGFKNAFNVGTDVRTLLNQTADIVIGQPDLYSNIVNYNRVNPGGSSSTQPTATGLFHPVGVAVDANGNLLVADSGNSRVVRFPAPFAQSPGTAQTANLVLGQANLTSQIPGVSQFNMETPYGLALFANGSLAVSDPAANRVLIFERPGGGDFTQNQGAAFVVGQSNFNSSTAGDGVSITELKYPLHMAVDSGDNLYVGDYGDGRLAVFGKPTASDPSAVLTIAVGGAAGVAVSQATGLIWITNGSNLYQLPGTSTLQSSGFVPSQQLLPQFQLTDGSTSLAFLALALDPFDNPIAADSTNRVSFFFNRLFYRNTANYSTGADTSSSTFVAGPTPTMLAELHQPGAPFNLASTYSGQPANLAPPWPLSVNNNTLQVKVAGIPAPIFRVDTAAAVPDDGGVLIEIPNEAPNSGPADFVISNPATGQIYAAATLNMVASSPGIYTMNAEGTGPAAALSLDSKGNYLGINSQVPVPTGGIIDLWLTGAGNVPGLPADGTAPGSAVYTSIYPTVYINGTQAQVIGSAMSPAFPGVWQINAIVPSNAPPGAVSVVVQMNGYNSNVGRATTSNVTPGPDQNLTVPNGLITTINVK